MAKRKKKGQKDKQNLLLLQKEPVDIQHVPFLIDYVDDLSLLKCFLEQVSGRATMLKLYWSSYGLQCKELL